MPRRPRLELPGIPLHITQRGVNRAAVFIDDEDRRHYLALLGQALRQHEIALHAYVLMGNHVHLLASAPRAGVISQAMRNQGQCYVQAFNRRHRRTGTLWEGRFKSCLVDSDDYLLTVYRYIERNPVRAAMVASPEDHPWSSVHANLGLHQDPLVTAHPTYVALGPDLPLRVSAYRQWLDEGVEASELLAIRRYIEQQRAYGDARFQSMIEKTLNRPAVVRPQGRPRRQGSNRRRCGALMVTVELLLCLFSALPFFAPAWSKLFSAPHGQVMVARAPPHPRCIAVPSGLPRHPGPHSLCIAPVGARKPS